MLLPKLDADIMRRLIVVLLAAIIAFSLFSGLTNVTFPVPVVLTIHHLFELISILLGFVIFFITWYSNKQDILHATGTSLVLLCVSILELAHLLTYPGMPGAVAVESSFSWLMYGVTARLVWSLGLLYVVCLPRNNVTFSISKHTLLSAALILLTALIVNIAVGTYSSSYFLGGAQMYTFVRLCTYLSILAGITALFYLRRYCHELTSVPPAALLCGILADLSFAFVEHSPVSLNISGHLLKLAAAYFVLRAIFIVVIKQPYYEMLKLKDEMESLASKNAKLYEESEEQRNLVEDTLSKIGMIISSQLNLKDTLDSIADMVADMMRARQSAIALLSKDASTLQVAATYGINTPPAHIPLQNSVAAMVLETSKALCVDDLTLHPELFRPQLIFSSIRSIVCAPLVNEDEIIGVIEAYASEKQAFSERDALLLQALGYHAGAAVSSAMLYEETKLRLDEEKFLYQITQAAAASLDIDTIMEQCTLYTMKALDADLALGLLNGEHKGIFTVKAAIGINCKVQAIELAAYEALAAALNQYKPLTTGPDIFPPLADAAGKNTVRHIMVLPLTVDHRLLGVILLGWQRFVAADHLDRTSFANLMSQQIALGLEKAHLYNQVKAMALSDGLTGLANRRNFDMFLKTELRRAASLKRPLSLIMFDLDKFKTYNDTYGHLTGDKLLAQIGQLLHANVRNIDFPARYGGEEFSIILPECNNAEATAIAEKLRKTVEETQFPDNVGTFTARITASLGVTTYDPRLSSSVPDAEKIIAVADKALYQAKDQGRNRVINMTLLD